MKKGDAEFLELTNGSGEAVNLRGARFTHGINFRFAGNRDTLLAPGQKLVLVRNLFQFRRRHGPDVPVEEIYSRNRKNADGCVTLSAESGQVIASRLIDQASP
ncbi:MAG: lamin tail domain-containing protein [Pedosphaera sp.]|nr:lamin tail domain-containing protein [Pedosphaera sp.]